MNRDLWIAMVGGLAAWFLGPVLMYLICHIIRMVLDRFDARMKARKSARDKALALALADHIIRKKAHRPGFTYQVQEGHEVASWKTQKNDGPDKLVA
jgi:hypothetical protein